ncbi:MAG TPA: hypothetical protein V6C76_13865 [Drouetiella sp.]
MRLFAKYFFSAALSIGCASPVLAENEDLAKWEEVIKSGHFEKLEPQLEAARKEALEKNDYVRVAGIEELQTQISRKKALVGGSRYGNVASMNDAVRLQMLALQAQVERFAKKHKGKYPVALNKEFEEYFPAISINNSKSTAPFYNPFTKKQEWFAIKPLNSVQEAEAEPEAELPKGQIFYCPIKHGVTYAIIAGANDGKLLKAKNGLPLVMTKN